MKYVKKWDNFVNSLIKESNGFWGNQASGILPICESTGRILIGLRSLNVNEPHTWGNFGGAIGLDDNGMEEESLSPKDNALKEMEEELGYYGDIRLIDSYIFEQDGFRYSNYIGLVREEFEPELNWETETTKWVSFDELLSQNDKHYGLIAHIENSSEQLKKHSRNA